MHRHSRRFISGIRKPEEIQSYTLSRGTVGRKVFKKSWSHLEPRYPVNTQERFHRAAVERVFHPSIVENVRVSEDGKRDTLEWRMWFETNALDQAQSTVRADFKQLSPWHDIPLGFMDGNNQLYFNYVNEISHGGRAKMECATKEAWNPIKQDVKKGALRYFKYGDLPFNYGFIPQTYEDPHDSSAFLDDRNTSLGGDDDPVDVVELSDPAECALAQGQIVAVKVLAVLGLIDEGEVDWKIVGLRADHPHIADINSIEDANRVLGRNVGDIIVDWFENYKVPDGKGKNTFSHNAEYQSAETAVKVIEETHRQWYNLMMGGIRDHDLSLTSVTHKYLVAQGVTSVNELDELPRIEYPRLLNWRPRPLQKFQTVDHCEEDYEIREPSPDQERK
eukprot:CAMPEP_0202686012 /NCGR_PEP_ID=MMETSP1385-20130828/1796_1 /ASSEMBLY_ACC=CAM_ASM_000861 /TAXON_ID=933848 /ORGANISM="Elphidium margaritaceum" /LENGTH=390 /DNA_ID=CAMNT_0049340495 /DNA_START=27 /DNA_END=1199 /DNA_ORIENTATION=+